MGRVNLTLDTDTHTRLVEHAKHLGLPQAATARQLIREALARRDALDRRRKLASDYAAGGEDAEELLAELEAGQLELLDDEDG